MHALPRRIAVDEKDYQKNVLGHAREEDADLLLSVANQIEGRTICAFGEAASWPTQSFIAKFRDEFEVKAKNGSFETHSSIDLISMSSNGKTSSITINLNGNEVDVPAGINLVEAAAIHGTEVPHYCYHPQLSVAGNCRMCLVEMGNPMRDRGTGEPILTKMAFRKLAGFPNQYWLWDECFSGNAHQNRIFHGHRFQRRYYGVSSC